MSKPKKEKTTEDTKRFVEKIAKHKGWKMNPDENHSEYIVKGLTKNFNRYGYYSCPCRWADGTWEKDKDLVCPCDYAPPDLEEFGYCFCRLFLTEEFFASGKPAEKIPARRRVKILSLTL